MNRPSRLFVLLALAAAVSACSVGSLEEAPTQSVAPSASPTPSPAPSSSLTPEQPSCETSWGALPKTHLVTKYTTATVANLRAGSGECFDRLVVDLGPRRQGLPGLQGEGYQVRYVPEARSSGTRDRLPIEGAAFLAVVVNAAAHDDDYEPTYEPRDRGHAVDVTGFRTFRQVAFLGTFEAQTDIVIGVRAALPFRVFVLSGPDMGSRLVVDVAHT